MGQQKLKPKRNLISESTGYQKEGTTGKFEFPDADVKISSKYSCPKVLISIH